MREKAIFSSNSIYCFSKWQQNNEQNGIVFTMYIIEKETNLEIKSIQIQKFIILLIAIYWWNGSTDFVCFQINNCEKSCLEWKKKTKTIIMSVYVLQIQFFSGKNTTVKRSIW